jgi:hypothetical protein
MLFSNKPADHILVIRDIYELVPLGIAGPGNPVVIIDCDFPLPAGNLTGREILQLLPPHFQLMFHIVE